MGELQLISTQSRPEHLLARIVRGDPNLLMQLEHRIDGRADIHFRPYRQALVIERSIAANRTVLAAMPTNEEVAELAEAVRPVLARCTDTFIRNEVANLIGSYPNANITDPETFISALIFDLLDARMPDSVVYLACQTIRRTSRFLPTIAEVFQAAERERDRWAAVLEYPMRLAQNRAIVADTLKEAEEALASILEEDRQRAAREAEWERRREEAKKPGARRYTCAYPSLTREFEGNEEMLSLISGLDFDSQSIASSMLASKGREAAEAMIRKRAGGGTP